ncbi:unnamed protein product [Prunus armeniaca]
MRSRLLFGKRLNSIVLLKSSLSFWPTRWALEMANLGFMEEMIEDYVGEDAPPLSSAKVEVVAGGRDNAEDAAV